MTSLHPKVLIADRLDAEGRHDDAINELSYATQAGDLEAMTRLGKRLVVGDRAPCLPREGAGFVFEAASGGHADAAALMAVFQGLGVFQRKSWDDALVTLGHAARLGSASAREQLVLLAGDTGRPVADETDFAWSGLVERIDLGAWLSPAPGHVVCEEPLIKSFPGFLAPALCGRLIALSRHRLKPALVYDPGNKRDVHSTLRSNSIAQFNLVENELIHFLLQERMAATCGMPMVNFEATAILHYKPGEQISNHYDFVNPDLPDYEEEIARNGQRMITFLVYLNDAYAAGETVFPKLGIRHRGQIGEGFFFTNALPAGAPDRRVLHAGSPPERGEKWIVSQFIRNRPVKYVQ